MDPSLDQKLPVVATLRRERRLKLAAVVGILLVGGIVLVAVDNLLVSFVFAFVINYLLAPIVDWLERKGASRQTAILIPFASAGALMAFGIYKILPLITDQLSVLESQLPKYQYDLMHLVSSTEQHFKGFFKLYDIKFSQSLNTWILNKTAELSSSIPAAVSGSLTVLLLSPFFAFFMLQDGRRVSRSILRMVPNDFFELALGLRHRINEQLGGFIRARFLEAAIIGGVVWIGLEALGFPYAGLLAVFAGVTNLIPYIGPIIGAVPAVLIALISAEGMIAAGMGLNLVLVTSVYFIAQLIDIVFIIPLVVAKIVNLHPVTVIIVIIIGSQLMGILGMVISIPVASAVKLTSQALYDHLTA
jgi:putative permease